MYFSVILDNVMKVVKDYQGMCRIWLANRLFLFLGLPEHLEVILNKCLKKDEFYKFGEVVVGYGLVTAPG